MVRAKHNCDALEAKKKAKPKKKKVQVVLAPYEENSDPEDYY
jgi:hypothetical protein